MNKAWFLIFLLVIPLVSGVSPFKTSVTSDTSLHISYPPYTYLEKDKDFNLYFHVVNNTEMVLDASCIVHLYSRYGNHTCESGTTLDENGLEYKLVIDKGNFSEVGKKSFIFICNTTDEVGYSFGEFFINYTGNPLGDSEVFMLMVAVTMLLTLLYLVVKSIFLPQFDRLLFHQPHSQIIYFPGSFQ